MSADSLFLVSQLAIGLVFLTASVNKLRDISGFFAGINEYGIVPAYLVRAVGVAVVVAEALVALSHLSGWLLVVAVPASVVLLSAFLIAIVVTIRRGLTVPCLCFGVGADHETASLRSAIRLISILAIEAALLYRLLGSSDWPSPLARSGGELLAALLAAALALTISSWVFSSPEVIAALRPCPRDRDTFKVFR